MSAYIGGLTFVAQSGAGPWGMNTPWGFHMMWGSLGIGMLLFMLVFWVLVIVGILALIRWAWTGASGPSAGGRSAESALDILKKRYARGEIKKEEYEAMRRDLQS